MPRSLQGQTIIPFGTLPEPKILEIRGELQISFSCLVTVIVPVGDVGWNQHFNYPENEKGNEFSGSDVVSEGARNYLRSALD